MQTLKDQIYYMQQHILHLRAASSLTGTDTEQLTNILPDPNTDELNSKITRAEASVKEMKDEFRDQFQAIRSQVDDVSDRLDSLESDAKKYNLVVRGLEQARVLERQGTYILATCF